MFAACYLINFKMNSVDTFRQPMRFASAVCPSCNIVRPLHRFMNGRDRVYNVCRHCLGPNQPSWFIYKSSPTPSKPSWFVYILAAVSLLVILAAALKTLPLLLPVSFQLIAVRGFTTPTANATAAFRSLFVFRYLRLAVNIFSYFSYKPSPILANPSYNSRDVTVLIPTVEHNDAFLNCVRSACENSPTQLFVITVGDAMRDAIDASLQNLRAEFPTVNMQVHFTERANKRRQLDAVVPLIQTKITCLVDATAIWGPRFFRSALAPLEDPNVCLVGTNKRVQRSHGAGRVASLWNLLGCLYLERHNFEVRAQNAISGEAFVISGRTNLIRTAIVQDPAFRVEFVNERLLLGRIGPLAPDDDNFISRWVLKRGGGIKFQYDDHARINIAPIGEFPRFLYQCVRWSRTTWRSNPAALKIRHVWTNQPYSVYSIYLASFFNFALLSDPLLVYLCYRSDYDNNSWTNLWLLVIWMFCSKMVKVTTYFWREPRDLLFFPFCIIFAYCHSLIKLWALLTFWNVEWTGRDIELGLD